MGVAVGVLGGNNIMNISNLSYSTFTALSILGVSLVACGGSKAEGTTTGARANGNSAAQASDEGDAGARRTQADAGSLADNGEQADEPVDDEEPADDEETADDEEVTADDEEQTQADGGAGEEDTEAPTLVATTPESDSPQRSDVTVSFQFSEPMDQQSVEDAYNSLSLPKESITFEWNEAGDTVTLIPIEPFAYADGNAGGAYGYGFSILETATDLAGNPLGEAATVSFSTYRRFVFEAVLESTLTGWVGTGGATGTDLIYVGDTAITDNTLYGFVGFSLAGFPAEYEEIELADLIFAQTATTAAVADLGQLYANQTFHDEVSSYALSADMLGAAPVSDVGFSEVLGDYRMANVIEIVEDDLANREARTDLTRYRLMFSLPTDEDGKLDRVTLDVNPTLTLTYLAE